MSYLRGFGTKATPQNESIPGSTQVPNSAGGYTWAVDDWVRLDRFLILGSSGGSYYASERKLTKENADAVLRCIHADSVRVVNRIVEISEAGRAPKNDPAIFALAMVSGMADQRGKQAAWEALPRVCRIGTHIQHFCSYVEGFRGWGRGLRTAVGDWYNKQDAQLLAYQVIKYQSRDKWSNRDLLRLAHPKPISEKHSIIYHWITQGWDSVGTEPHPDSSLRLIWAFERAKRAETEQEIINLILDYNLPRECIPTQWLTSANVWEALLVRMPMTAMIRNLATMTRVGLIKPLSIAASEIARRLTDGEALRQSRVHPVQVLTAMLTYAQGHGQRSEHTWQPVTSVIDALDTAFYRSFGNVEPTDKRLVLALDVSGSMTMGTVAGVEGLTPRVASAALALVTAATEQNYVIVAFCDRMVPLSISPRMRLDDVVRTVSNLSFGATDCALPMLWATQNKVQADGFVILTDSETWYGGIHPSQALQQYRRETGTPAKLAVCGMVSNNFSIADPNDAGMIDCVGFDVATHQVISDFIRQ